jgi:hypothetical protein
MKIGFVLFEQYHQRKDIGSSRIRGHWLIKHMPEAELFQQGKKYDAIVFQKAYWKEAAREFPGKKILDICDPDWLDGAEVVSFSKHMDAITVPTEALAEELKMMTKKPVYVIPDRIDLDTLIPPKKHEGRAKSVVWFGYSHNAEKALEPTLLKLKKLGLRLIVISDGNFITSECEVENVKWNIETVNEEIQKADFVLLPEVNSGRYLYKSPNKTHQAWALGMPVAKTSQDVERFMDGEERQKEADEKYRWAMENCDVRLSVGELRKVIESV